jgi:predicted GNAT family N-acyltransferase
MQISFSNGSDKEYKLMLNSLLKDIFLDFQFWYDLNVWDEDYESYSINKNGEIVSNICVFKTQVLFNHERHLALSVGAVATKKEFRGQGLSRVLMEHILKKYDSVPMYLSANDGVLDFYPRFGFHRIHDKLPVCHCRINNNVKPNKLRYDDPKVWNYVYKRTNFSGSFDCVNTAGINIFHIYLGYLKNSIYELPEISTMVIAEQQDETLKLIGVFSLKEIHFSDFVKYLPFTNVDRIEFGFMPYWSDVSFIMEEYETDPQFVRGLRCNLGDFKFPELSVT